MLIECLYGRLSCLMCMIFLKFFPNDVKISFCCTDFFPFEQNFPDARLIFSPNVSVLLEFPFLTTSLATQCSWPMRIRDGRHYAPRLKQVGFGFCIIICVSCCYCNYDNVLLYYLTLLYFSQQMFEVLVQFQLVYFLIKRRPSTSKSRQMDPSI